MIQDRVTLEAQVAVLIIRGAQVAVHIIQGAEAAVLTIQGAKVIVLAAGAGGQLLFGRRKLRILVFSVNAIRLNMYFCSYSPRGKYSRRSPSLSPARSASQRSPSGSPPRSFSRYSLA